MKTFTKDEKALFKYIEGLVEKKGHLEFDFRDQRQYDFAVMHTKKHFDTKRYPGKLKELELLKLHQKKHGFTSALNVANNGSQNAFMIPGLGHTPAGINTIASNGFGTLTGGYSNMSLMLFIKDKASGNIIASGTNNQLVGTVLPVWTNVARQASPSLNVTSYLQYSATPMGGGTPIAGIVAQGAYNAAADPSITAPVFHVPPCTNPYVPNAINIGINRPWGDPALGVNLDYIFSQPTQPNPVGVVPFVGNVTFNQAIQPLSPNTNFLLQIYVANQTSGGTITLNPTNLANVYANFSIDPTNPNKLKWNLPGGTSAGNPGNPISFGNVTWPTDMLAMFYCQILVTLADGSFGSANVQSQVAPDADPLDGTLGIPQISFIWHCLGEDTEVNMADGTKKPIAKVISGDKVVTDNKGGTAIVRFTNKGIHIGSVLLIKTDGNNEITTSHNHVFLTSNLPTPASELKVGDILQTIDGNKKILSIENLPKYNGMFYNISTGNSQHHEKSKGTISTFVANGFMVGDINAQRMYKEILINDINWVKKQVPAYLHTDVDSYFKDRVKK